MKSAHAFLALVSLALVSLSHCALSVEQADLRSSAAPSDSSELAGGVLIAHHAAGMTYTSDEPPEGWGGRYLSQHQITSAAQQVNRIDATDRAVFWFVLAAWNEPKTFCGVEFGLGNCDENAFAIAQYFNCGTSSGPSPLEIPFGNWPGPNSGIAVVIPNGSWIGNYVPIYGFAGYAYAPGTLIPLRTHPDAGIGGWADCSVPARFVPITCFGAMGILRNGHSCTP